MPGYLDWQILAATEPAKITTIIITQFNEVSQKRIIISSENIKKEYKQSYTFLWKLLFCFPTEFQAALGAWEIKQRKATK